MSAGRILGLVVALAAVGAGVVFAVGAFEEDPPSTTVSAALVPRYPDRDPGPRGPVRGRRC